MESKDDASGFSGPKGVGYMAEAKLDGGKEDTKAHILMPTVCSSSLPVMEWDRSSNLRVDPLLLGPDVLLANG